MQNERKWCIQNTNTNSDNLGKHQFLKPFCSNKSSYNANSERFFMNAGLKTLEASTSLHSAIFFSNLHWPMPIGKGFTTNIPVNTTAP